MLKVQEYLVNKSNELGTKLEALEALKQEFGIKYRLYPEDSMVLLDYDQINSPKSHPIVIECRSLILCCHTFGVVSRKFDRFFNYGECPEYYEDFDFSKAQVFEKVDGSLIGIYYNFFTDKWEISTRGMAKAEGPHSFYPTFRDCVLDTFGFRDENHFQSVFDDLSLQHFWAYEEAFARIDRRYYTFVFECIGPKNKCVKRYDDAEMVCLGVIENFTGKTLHKKEFEVERILSRDFGLYVRLPKVYEASDAESIVKMVSEFKDLDEGVVAFDPVSNKRVKIKSATYVAAHKLRGNDPVPTKKNLLTVIFEGEVDELLAYFPEFKEYIDPLQARLNWIIGAMGEDWLKVKDIESQKDFALAVKDKPYSNVLFEARKKNENPVKVFEGMTLSYKLRLFGE